MEAAIAGVANETRTTAHFIQVDVAEDVEPKKNRFSVSVFGGAGFMFRRLLQNLGIAIFVHW